MPKKKRRKKDYVSVNVLLPREHHELLERMAEDEFTSKATILRRFIATLVESRRKTGA